MPKPVRRFSNPKGINGRTKRPKVKKEFKETGTEAYKNRESDLCQQCHVHFMWHNSKYGFCYWCDKLAKDPELKRS